MENAVDIRKLIPLTGLKEYWYPIVLEREVKKQPILLKRLGVDLVAFRGKSENVVVFHNACPHRGAYLSEGSCTFEGFLTCFYHGYTFDEHGECVAVLGEGPESPMVGKVKGGTPTSTVGSGAACGADTGGIATAGAGLAFSAGAPPPSRRWNSSAKASTPLCRCDSTDASGVP